MCLFLDSVGIFNYFLPKNFWNRLVIWICWHPVNRYTNIRSRVVYFCYFDCFGGSKSHCLLYFSQYFSILSFFYFCCFDEKWYYSRWYVSRYKISTVHMLCFCWLHLRRTHYLYNNIYGYFYNSIKPYIRWSIEQRCLRSNLFVRKQNYNFK